MVESKPISETASKQIKIKNLKELEAFIDEINMDHRYLLIDLKKCSDFYIEPSNMKRFYFLTFIDNRIKCKTTKKPIWKYKILDYVKYLDPLFSEKHLKIEKVEPYKKNRWINEIKTKKMKAFRDVYFIQSEIGGPIKIGVSEISEERLASFQIYYPFKLIILATIQKGGYKKEVELHKKFKRYRLHGEWFEPVPEILEYIQSIKNILEEI